MKTTTSIAGLVLFLSTVASVSNANTNWTKHGSSDGVTVFTAEASDSDVPRVRAVSQIEASPDDVWAHLTGSDLNIKGLKTKRKVGSCGTDCDYTYFRLEYPLVKDRHYVLKTTSRVVEKDGMRSYKRSWVSVSSMVPQDDEAIVIEKMSGSWTLKPVDGGNKTRLIYENHVDLGGSLPASIFGIGFVNKTYEIVHSIRKKITGA